jgi:hypothetical protein
MAEWWPWSEVQGGGTTDAPVSATSFDQRIYVFAKGVNDGQVYVNSAYNAARKQIEGG